MSRPARVATVVVTASVAFATFMLAPASAKQLLSTPQAPPPRPAVAVDRSGADVKVSVEPGAVIDAVIAFLNALSLRGGSISTGPAGLNTHVELSATGAVAVKASVKACPEGGLCLYNEQDFGGPALILSPSDVDALAGRECYPIHIETDGRPGAYSVVNNSDSLFDLYLDSTCYERAFTAVGGSSNPQLPPSLAYSLAGGG